MQRNGSALDVAVAIAKRANSQAMAIFKKRISDCALLCGDVEDSMLTVVGCCSN